MANKKPNQQDEDFAETSDESSGKPRGDGPRLGEALKKVFTIGTSAAFITEETIKSYLGELKLPKEVLQALIQGANKSKDELTQRVTKEIIGILSKIDWVKEAQRFAETHKFKITAEIDIIKKDQKNSGSSVTVKSSKK